MKIKAQPSEWERILGICVLDPDGWDRKNPADWNTPITLNDFLDKCDESTTLHYTGDREYYLERAKQAI